MAGAGADPVKIFAVFLTPYAKILLILSPGEGIHKIKMSNKLRAKFIVNQSTNFGQYDQVKMSAVYSHNRAKEDNQFSEATPSGSLEMMISDKGARDFLKPGVKYILTFEEAEHQD